MQQLIIGTNVTEILNMPLFWGIAIPGFLVWIIMANGLMDYYQYPFEYILPVKLLVISAPAWIMLICVGVM